MVYCISIEIIAVVDVNLLKRSLRLRMHEIVGKTPFQGQNYNQQKKMCTMIKNKLGTKRIVFKYFNRIRSCIRLIKKAYKPLIKINSFINIVTSLNEIIIITKIQYIPKFV